jgi:ABC-type lipopolysaccharide export system ATPase subunit
MQVDLHSKLKAMLWDMPETQRMKIANEILSKPVEMFMNDDQIFIKALNSLKWYELTRLVGKQNLHMLLTDHIIQKLFPVQRRTYYANARRLLSKYAVPTSR